MELRRLKHLMLPPNLRQGLKRWIEGGIYGAIFDVLDSLDVHDQTPRPAAGAGAPMRIRPRRQEPASRIVSSLARLDNAADGRKHTLRLANIDGAVNDVNHHVRQTTQPN